MGVGARTDCAAAARSVQGVGNGARQQRNRLVHVGVRDHQRRHQAQHIALAGGDHDQARVARALAHGARRLRARGAASAPGTGSTPE